ncbi:hypothetical protein JOF53_001732 [Crossiella equi]|uniref:Low molecular weight protein antigen 6 PH domain-containing protein n=1 Tax=Crossiella equi TaxID=130796 RepID=A0ABS5A8E0_9PSEU|nr:PH domain-containing protein [Crossiella equi]MBP2472860.1 hypothetical protein [Crossiella equi]
MTEQPAAGTTVVIRPKIVRIFGFVLAPILFLAFAAAGVFMRVTYTGAYFTIADQVAMVIVGVLLAAGALVLTRPRLLVDDEGVDVRGFVARKRLSWQEVLGVSFPERNYFAKLDLPHDEHYPAIAVMSWDGQHAVRAIKVLRERHARAHQS